MQGVVTAREVGTKLWRWARSLWTWESISKEEAARFIHDFGSADRGRKITIEVQTTWVGSKEVVDPSTIRVSVE